MFVVLDAVSHPVVSSFLVAILYISVNTIVNSNSATASSLQLSYVTIQHLGQYSRFLTSPFIYATFLSLLFDVSSLWSLRILEDVLGSFFVFRYTLLLFVLEPLMSMLLIFIISRLSYRLNHTGDANAIKSHYFSGSSGIILAWLTFAAFDVFTNPNYMKFSSYFYLFGFIPLAWAFAAPLFAVLLPVVSYKQTIVSNISGLLAGFLLYSGFAAILPDVYWTLCFAINGLLLMMTTIANASASQSQQQNSNIDHSREHDPNVCAVIEFDNTALETDLVRIATTTTTTHVRPPLPPEDGNRNNNNNNNNRNERNESVAINVEEEESKDEFGESDSLLNHNTTRSAKSSTTTTTTTTAASAMGGLTSLMRKATVGNNNNNNNSKNLLSRATEMTSLTSRTSRYSNIIINNNNNNNNEEEEEPDEHQSLV